MDPQEVSNAFLEQSTTPEVMQAHPGLGAVRTDPLEEMPQKKPRFRGDQSVNHFATTVGDLYAKRMGDLGLGEHVPAYRPQLEAAVKQRAQTYAVQTLAKRMQDEGHAGRTSDAYLAERVPFMGLASTFDQGQRMRRAGEAFQGNNAQFPHYRDVAQQLAREKSDQERGPVGQGFDILSQAPAMVAEWAMSGGTAPGAGLMAKQGAGAFVKSLGTRAGVAAAGKDLAKGALGTIARQAPTAPYRIGAQVSQQTAPSPEMGENGFQMREGAKVGSALARSLVHDTVERGMFGAIDPLHAKASESIAGKALSGLWNWGGLMAAGELSQDASDALTGARPGGALYRLSTATAPAERTQALQDLLASGTAFAIIEGAIHMTGSHGSKLDHEKAVGSIIDEVIKDAAEKEQPPAQPAVKAPRMVPPQPIEQPAQRETNTPIPETATVPGGNESTGNVSTPPVAEPGSTPKAMVQGPQLTQEEWQNKLKGGFEQAGQEQGRRGAAAEAPEPEEPATTQRPDQDLQDRTAKFLSTVKPSPFLTMPLRQLAAEWHIPVTGQDMAPDVVAKIQAKLKEHLNGYTPPTPPEPSEGIAPHENLSRAGDAQTPSGGPSHAPLDAENGGQLHEPSREAQVDQEGVAAEKQRIAAEQGDETGLHRAVGAEDRHEATPAAEQEQGTEGRPEPASPPRLSPDTERLLADFPEYANDVEEALAKRDAKRQSGEAPGERKRNRRGFSGTLDYGKRALPNVPSGPESGRAPVGEAAIGQWIQKAFDLPIRRGRTSGEPAYADVRHEVVRTKTGNLGVISHEVAHVLDERNNLVKQTPVIARQDLLNLHHDMQVEMLNDPNITPHQQAIIQNQPLDEHEGFAEFVRHYLTRDDAAQEAPHFDRFFRDWLQRHPDETARLQQAKDLIDTHRGMSTAQKLQANQTGLGETIRPAGETAAARMLDAVLHPGKALSKLYQSMFNQHEWTRGIDSEFEKRTGKKGTLQLEAENLEHTAAAQTHAAMQDGHRMLNTQKIVGPALLPALRKAGIIDAKGRPDPKVKAEVGALWSALDGLEKLSWDQDRFAGQYDENKLRDAVKELGTPERIEAIRQMVKYRNAGVDLLVDAGRLKADEARIIKSRPLDDADHLALNEGRAKPEDFYAEFSAHLPRNMEGEGIHTSGGGTNIEMKNGIRGRREMGSDRPTINPVDAMILEDLNRHGMANDSKLMTTLIKQTEAAGSMGKYMEEVDPRVARKDFNVSRAELVKAGIPQSVADQLDPMTLISIVRRNMSVDPTKYEARLIIDGKERLFRMDKDVFAGASKVASEHFLPMYLDQASRISAKIVREGAIALKSTFQLAKAVYDTTMHVFKEDLRNFFGPLTRGLPSVLRHYFGKNGDPIFRMWERLGGPTGQHRGTREQVATQLLNESGGGGHSWLGKLIRTPGELVHGIDSIYRMSAFQYGLEKQGHTPEQIRAGKTVPLQDQLAAKDRAMNMYHNYNRAGESVKSLSPHVPFLQATISLMEDPVRFMASNPGKIATRVAILSSGMVAYAMFMQRFPWYRNMDPDQRGRYLFIPGPNGEPSLKIPMHGAWGALLKLPEALTNAAIDGSSQPAKEWLEHSLKHAFIPPGVPSLVRPIMEQWANKDWRGMPIVSDDMQQRRKEDQYDERTMELSKGIAKHMPSFTGLDSPARMDHVLRGYTGGAYGTLEGAAEHALGLRQMRPSETPVVGGFLVNGEPNRDLHDFHEEHMKLQQEAGSERFHSGAKAEETAAKLKKMNEYHGLIVTLGDLIHGGSGKLGDPNHPKASRQSLAGDEKFAIDKYRMGLARAAMGRPDEPRYPNPLKEKDLPANVKPVVDRWLGGVVEKAFKGDEPSRQIVRDAKVPSEVQSLLIRKLKVERAWMKRGLSGEAAKARVWGFEGDAGQRRAMLPKTRSLVPTNGGQ